MPAAGCSLGAHAHANTPAITVMAVGKFNTAPRGFWPALAAPYIMEKTLIMSTMGLPVKFRAALEVEGVPGAGEEGVAGADVLQGDAGHAERALMGLLTVFSSRPASLGPRLSTETFTEPAGGRAVGGQVSGVHAVCPAHPHAERHAHIAGLCPGFQKVVVSTQLSRPPVAAHPT